MRAKRFEAGVRPMGGVILLLALLGLAIAPIAAAEGSIAFERCPGPDGEGWECATHTVPLDHWGASPGTIDLAVRRYRPEGAPDPSGRPPFVALAGGPGQSAISVAGLFSSVFGEATSAYQLIVYDQRGTGLSGALDCPATPSQAASSDPLLDDARAQQIARCAEQLGPRRTFYTTLDSVADIDSLREALGAETIGIGGVSYGTYVSAVYAQQHPQRTERIVLDSVVPPGGDLVMQEPTFKAVRRVVTEQCDDNRCQRVTPTPRGDLARVASQLRTGRISAPHHTPQGRRTRATFNSEHLLLQAMVAGDLNPALRAGQPAAIRAAALGDGTPLLRFVTLALTAGGSPAQGLQEPGPDMSPALYNTTVCTDSELPWPASLHPGEERNRLVRNALAAVPQGSIRPFGRPALRGMSFATQCRLWPLTDSASPPAHPPFPDVPTLIVNGSADLRTPNASAIAARSEFAPNGTLLLVEGQGHSVLGSVECADIAVERFFADQPIGDPCAGVNEAMPVQQLAPRRVRGVQRAPRTRGQRGRTLGAVLATIGDVEWLADVHRGGRFRLGGLRNGWVAWQPGRTRAILRRLAYVPGVRVSGSLRAHPRGRLVGSVRVAGPRAINGIVRFRANGRVVASLRGERVLTRIR